MQDPLLRPEVDGRPSVSGLQGDPRARPPRAAGATAEEVRWRDVLPFPAEEAPPQPWGPKASASVLPASPPPESQTVGISVFGVLFRLVQLLFVIVYLALARFFDWLVLDRLRGGDREGRKVRLVYRRAARLRQALLWLGGTYIKIGQQLAIRSDILPPAYCDALNELLDKVPPVSADYVRKVIREELGGSIEEVFASFDLTPVGSASVACVYKARLWDGDVVAVKVRRPRIVRRFKTDLAALDLVLGGMERLTLLRPHVSGTFRSELRQMLLEELDFTVEARYQELFRTYFKRRKKLRTTAPRIYPDLCTRQLLVSEFVDGIWLKDMLVALDNGDHGYRERLREQGISPKKVAKQLIRGSHYAFFECPFFHGDPHPGNIVVQPGNRLVMVDFGACGVFAHRERYQLAQMHEFHAKEDVGGMVQCVIGLMEPLPPIDVDCFRRRLEEAWWKGFYGIKSKHAKWWERTSFRLWSALFREVRVARIPLPLNVLRMIRATLLYDSVAARLYRKIDVFEEYRWYRHRYARRVRDDFYQGVVRTIFRGPDADFFVRLRRLWEVGNLALRQAQVLLRRPLPDFSAQVSKVWDLLKIGIRWTMVELTVFTVTLVIGVYTIRDHVKMVLAETHADIPDTMPEYPQAFLRVVQVDLGRPGLRPPEILLIITAVLMFLVAMKYLREAWFRLSDKDLLEGSRGSRGGR